jgi:hypothetical protein
VGVLLWASCAYRLKDREQWIGWDALTCAKRRNLIVNNVRFLVLEKTRRPNLASKCLGTALKVLREQWSLHFGFEPILAETFTDPEMHAGTCYKAAGWQPVGMTEGNSRHLSDFYQPNGRPKRLWLYPLFSDAKARLCAVELAREHQAGESPGAGTRCSLKQTQLYSLAKALRQVPDPRAKAGMKFPLFVLLTVVCLGLLSGCKHVSEIVRLGNRLSPAQRRQIGFRKARNSKTHPMACYNVFRELLKRLDLEALGQVLTHWMSEQRGALPATLAMDGKTIRANLGMIVTIMDTEEGVPVAVAATTQSGGEATCARTLLQSPEVNLLNATLIADSLHTNAENARLIVQEKGGDYIAAVKDNQPKLHEHCHQQLDGCPPFLPRPNVGVVLSMNALRVRL